jgi:hypothetical protein
MKLKRREWILILAVVGVFALVWVSGGIREGFTQVPVVTKSDISAAGNPQSGSPALQQLVSWLNTNAPSLTGDFISNTVMYFYIFGTQYSSVSSPPSFDDFFNMFANGYTAYGMSGVTGDNLKKSYIARGDAISDAIYKYYFGTSMPTPPSTKPSPIAAKTNPSPMPASSSSTQPKTVGVPSPCRPSYKSIPGGSMEFKCFS